MSLALQLVVKSSALDPAPAAAPPRSTAYAEVRDYATRTFSRADAAEPSEPAHVRAVCCRRLAGGLLSCRMHWAPVPHRGPSGIASWTAVWLCMRCSNELAWERVQLPGPAPACMRCNVPTLWEVDMSARTERWVCGRCPATGPPRAVSLQDAARSTADPRPAQPTPCPPPLQHAVADMAQMPPPSLPFTQHTNSRIYVPLLLHAAGMVSPETRASWFADVSIGDWWRREVEAVSARPFLPVHDTVAAIAFVAQARGDDLRQSAPFERLVAWAAPRSSGAESLSTMLRAVAVPKEGHYFPAAIQEGLLTFQLGQHGASTLERDIAAYRQPNALPRAASPPPPFTQPAPSTPAPQPRGEAPSSQVVPAAPAPRRVRPHVCLTGAPDTTQGDHAVADRHDDAPPLTDDVPAAEASQGGAGHSALAGIPAAAWSSLDAVDLAAEFGTPVPTMQSVPVFLRSGGRQAFVLALLALREAYTRGTAPQQTRAWKLFLLAPRLLLHRPREPGTVGREALLQRSPEFLAGRWETLLSASQCHPHSRCRTTCWLRSRRR